MTLEMKKNKTRQQENPINQPCSFKPDMYLNESLTDALSSKQSKLNFQQKAISILLNSVCMQNGEISDVLLRAEKGSGKTKAIAIAMMQLVLQNRDIQIIFITPTRKRAEYVWREVRRIHRKLPQYFQDNTTIISASKSYDVPCVDCGMGLMLNDKKTFETQYSIQSEHKKEAFHCERCHACYVDIDGISTDDIDNTNTTIISASKSYDVPCVDCGMGLMLNDKKTFETQYSIQSEHKKEAFHCERCHACYVDIDGISTDDIDNTNTTIISDGDGDGNGDGDGDDANTMHINTNENNDTNKLPNKSSNRNSYDVPCVDCGMGLMLNDKNTFETQYSIQSEHKKEAFHCERCHACYVDIDGSTDGFRTIIPKPLLLLGGNSVRRDIRSLNNDNGKRWNIVIGTPGRIHDMINRGALQPDNVQILCIDRADRALGSQRAIHSLYDVFKFMPETTGLWISSVSDASPGSWMAIKHKLLRPGYAVVDAQKKKKKAGNTLYENPTIVVKLLNTEEKNVVQHVSPGSIKNVTVRVSNTSSSCMWTGGYLQKVGGDDLFVLVDGNPKMLTDASKDSVEIGSSVDVSFQLLAPKKSGTYASVWRYVCTNNGEQVCSERFWLQISVAGK